MTDITGSITGAPLTVAEEDRQAWQLLDEPQEWQIFSQATPGTANCWSSSVVFEGMLMLGSLGDGRWGMRLAGLALAGLSAWALWMGLVHDQAPWCVTPV